MENFLIAISIIICCFLFISFVDFTINKNFLIQNNKTIEEYKKIENKLDILIEQLSNRKIEEEKPIKSGYLKSDKNKTEELKEWKGGKSFDFYSFHNTVEKVVSQCPWEIKDEHGLIALIIETAAIESSFGEIVKQKKGIALGIFQIEPNTFKYLQKSASKEQKQFVSQYKNHKLNATDNLKYNIPYQIANCIILYSNFKVNEKDLSSKQTRAKIYKQYWNTSAGKATPKLYLKKANEHLADFYIKA